MEFSVLISVYIKEKAEYLDRSLNSVIKQTCIPSEIVLVKDGPLTEELNEVILKYVANYKNIFKIVELENNVGLGRALNIGINKCTYDIVARMDTDDICENDRFEKQMGIFKNNENIDIVGSYIVEFTSDKLEQENIRTVPTTHEEIVKYSKRRNPLNHMTVMYKKSSVLDSGSYQDSFLTEDYNLWVRMLIKGYRAMNIPESLVRVRCDENTYMRRGGIEYIKSEYSLQKKFLKWKHINMYEFVSNNIIRTSIRILPNNTRKFIYNSLLRLNLKRIIRIKTYAIFVLFINMFFSVAGIISSIPILIIIAILIKLEDGGPIIYTQERSGKDGKSFVIYKLRSMRLEAQISGGRWARKNDERITKVGKIIRRTRIDELPQFLNILKGDMSLIGPRPEVPELTEKFNEEVVGFVDRLKVKPGLTGWAQVNGGYDLTPMEKHQNDMFYIENRGVMLDVMIILKTIKVIVNGDGAR